MASSAVVARASAAMEHVLHGEILRDLDSLKPCDAAGVKAAVVESPVQHSLPAIESSVSASSLGAR